jgi:hypothetical protein
MNIEHKNDMRMKKFFTLFLFFLLTIGQMCAQEDNTFQFIDKDGNAVSSGTTLTVSQLTEDIFLGNYIATGLSVQNASDAQASLRVSYHIETMDNGMFQICFPTNCVTKDAAGEYVTTKGDMTASEKRDLQCEWFPQAYGTCKVTLAVEVLNALGTKTADGPAVHVVFQYSDPTRVNAVSAEAGSVERFNLQGVPVDARQKGISINRLSDGKIVKTITK